jgi:hypothetical protein
MTLAGYARTLLCPPTPGSKRKRRHDEDNTGPAAGPQGDAKLPQDNLAEAFECRVPSQLSDGRGYSSLCHFHEALRDPMPVNAVHALNVSMSASAIPSQYRPEKARILLFGYCE